MDASSRRFNREEFGQSKGWEAPFDWALPAATVWEGATEARADSGAKSSGAAAAACPPAACAAPELASPARWAAPLPAVCFPAPAARHVQRCRGINHWGDVQARVHTGRKFISDGANLRSHGVSRSSRRGSFGFGRLCSAWLISLDHIWRVKQVQNALEHHGTWIQHASHQLGAGGCLPPPPQQEPQQTSRRHCRGRLLIGPRHRS